MTNNTGNWDESMCGVFKTNQREERERFNEVFKQRFSEAHINKSWERFAQEFYSGAWLIWQAATQSEEDRFDTVFKENFPKSGTEKGLERIAEHFYNGCWSIWQAARQPQWISVKDQLPEDDQRVLVLDACGKVRICKHTLWEDRNTSGEFYLWDYDDDCNSFYSDEEVTHWMPLPEPPKEQAK